MAGPSPANFDYRMMMNVTGERLSQVQSREYYQQQGGGVIWLPDMKISGKLIAVNIGGTDYVFRSKENKIDPLDHITFVGANINGKNVSPADLPPLRYTYYTTGLVDDEPEIVLKPLDKTGAGQGVAAVFEFQTPEGYKWEEGKYILTFELDLVPDWDKL